MIICGFPGIGKTSLAKNGDVIDLDSSIFRVTESGVRPLLWEKYYCETASHLSKQGNTVFVSTHKEVLEYLKNNSDEFVCVIYPSRALKDFWIERLKNRYEKSGTDKDLRAYSSCKNNFDSYIQELSEAGFLKIELTSSTYKLSKLVTTLEEFVDDLPPACKLR